MDCYNSRLSQCSTSHGSTYVSEPYTRFASLLAKWTFYGSCHVRPAGDVDGRTYLCAGDSRRSILWVFETFDDAREINRVAGAHCHQGDVARAKFKRRAIGQR